MNRLYLSLMLYCLLEVGLGAQCTFAPVDVSSQECTSARFLCASELDGFSGTLSSMDTPGVQPDNYCGSSSPENIEWFSFMVSDPTVEIFIDFVGCSGGILIDQGFQTGVYSSCNFTEDDIQCESVETTSGTATLSFTTIPGIHYLFIDGFAGSICDYTIHVVSGVCDDPFALIDTPDAVCRPYDIRYPDSSSATVCLGTVQTIQSDADFPPRFDFCGRSDSLFSSIVDGQPFFCVETVVNPTTGFDFVSGEYVDISYTTPRDIVYSNVTSIRWNTVGTYQITQNIFINPSLPSCLNYDTICVDVLTVVVVPYDTTYLSQDTICQGEVLNFCGNDFSNTAILTCTNETDCSVMVKSLYVKPRVTIDLDTVYICDDQCFEIYGNTYCSEGDFMDAGPLYCDTLFLFSVVSLDLALDVTGDSLITCSLPSISLDGSYTTQSNESFTSYWKDVSGSVVGAGDLLTTAASGTYTYVVMPDVTGGCRDSISVVVKKDDDIPQVSIMSPLLSCLSTDGILSVISSHAIVSYAWLGPNGFAETSAMPTIVDTGEYSLSMVADNGCQFDTVFTVVGDFDEPLLILDYNDLDCNYSMGEAMYMSNQAVTNLWTFPDNSQSTSQILSYNSSGIYSVSITGSNGCIADSTFEILDLTHDPTIGMDVDTFWRCSTTSIAYDLVIPSDFNVDWSTLDGDFIYTMDRLEVMIVGTYIVTITDDVTGCVGADTLHIRPDTMKLVLDVNVTDPSCFGSLDGIVEIVALTGEAPYVISLDGAVSSSTIFDSLAAGEYHLHIVDTYGCEQDTIISIINPDAVTITSLPEITVKNNTATLLAITHNIPFDGLSDIIWFDSANNIVGRGEEITIDGEVADSYGVLIIDIDGCTDSISVSIIIDNSFDVFVPTIFSPNADGINDRWYLKTNGVDRQIESLQIFSRWGEMVFVRHNIPFNESSVGWDGTYNDTRLAPGVYVFGATYLDGDNILVHHHGTITIVR